MRRIPYPIPLLERSELIAAGKKCMSLTEPNENSSPELKAAQVERDAIEKQIRANFGVECEK